MSKVTISGTTKLFACFAHPASHVRAPTLFNEIFAKTGQDAIMVPMDIPPEGLAVAIAGLHAMENFKGAAVTIPHKLPLAALCDTLSPVARITGAVNAVRFEEGRLVGDNFDGAGFVAGLLGEGHKLADKKCLLIGAGGAARAIAYALSGEPITSLDIYNRTLSSAKALIALVTEHRAQAPLRAVEAPDYASYDIVINATSLGLKPDDMMPCDPHALADGALVCDIIMVPERTQWLAASMARGLACHKGRHMLDYQIQLIGDFIGVTKLPTAP